jgi:hypothetical protein
VQAVTGATLGPTRCVGPAAAYSEDESEYAESEHDNTQIHDDGARPARWGRRR